MPLFELSNGKGTLLDEELVAAKVFNGCEEISEDDLLWFSTEDCGLSISYES